MPVALTVPSAPPLHGEPLGGGGRGIGGIAALFLSLAVASHAACRPSPPAARVPTVDEAGPEQVVVNYAPQRLRALPAGNPESSYLLLGSERPLLPAVFRPLGVTARKAPPDVFARAGELAWVDGHVVAAAAPKGPAAPQRSTSVLVYDRDSKVATPADLPLPAACTQLQPALLHSDGRQLYALVRCPAQDAAVVLYLSGAAELRSAKWIAGAGAAELFLHRGDVDYLLAGARLLRSDAAGKTLTAALPDGGSTADGETRELVHTGELLFAIDGRAGRLFAVDGDTLALRFERALYSARPVTRLRAAIGGPSQLVVVTAEQGPDSDAATQLIAVALPLTPAPRGTAFPTRILLGSGPPRSDHELVPVAASDGGGVLLLRTHSGNTGPLVALTRLHL